jgi:O-antigen/teichoic acid export membrane protein
VIAQALGRAITLGAVVLSTAVVARAVGIEGYADWATVLSLVALVGFALDPGITPVIVRLLAQDPTDAPTPAAMRAVRLALASAALVAILCLTVALRGIDAAPAGLALGAQVLPRALVLNAAPWLQADHRLHRQTALEAVCAGLGLVLLVLVAAAGGSIELLAVAGFTGPAVVLAVLMRRELRLTPSSRLVSPGAQGPKVRAVLREVAPLAVALVLVTIYARIYVVFVNAAEDAAGVAQYLFAFQFVEQIFLVAGIIAATLLPLLARRARHTPLLGDRLTHELVVAITAFGAIGAAAIVASAAPVCRLIGGSKLADADRYLTLLAPMSALVLPAFLLGYLYLALGFGRRYLWFNLAGLVVNVAGNAALTLTYGADATARVSWATEAVVIACALAPIVRSGASGRATAVRVVLLVGGVVAGAELAAAGVVAPLVGAAAIATVALAGGGAHLRRLAALIRSDPPPDAIVT